MASKGNNRDVRMTLAVDTLGADDINKLKNTVAALAREGGEAAPEFQKLADEIGRIGEQAAALRAFEQLAAETQALATHQQTAATAAAELRARLDALSETSREASTRQETIASALQRAQQAARATRDELATLSATTDRAGKAEASYANEVERLKVAKIAQRAEIERLSAALAKANAEVKAAETNENQLAAAHARAAAAAAAAARAANDNSTALRAASSAALDLGVVTDTAAAQQAELIQGLNAAGAAAATLQQRVDRLAQQERDLAAIRAFEEQANEAQRLVQAAEYARQFERALQELAAAERQLKQQQDAAQWQREAEALVNAAHAAQKLARETQILEAAERELAAQRAFEKQAEEAMRLIRAADYVRNFREQLELAERQQRETADAAEQASKRISGAFSTLGVRSAADLQAEIQKVRQAMLTVQNQAGLTGGQLRSAFEAGEAKIRELERSLRAANGQLTLGDQASRLFATSMGQITAGNLVANGIGFLIQKVKDLVVAFVTTIVQTQNLKRALQAVYQDAGIAASQFAFLKKTANDAGVSLGAVQQSFVKFSAATRASGIGLEVTNRLFSEVARTAGILGLSGDQVTGVLEALGQMASKGTVSMEELRQQLGDRLPGALSLVAKGLGLTEAQLVKLVESGGLAARDLFPALTNALAATRGEATGLSTSYQRLKNILTETAQSAGDSIWTKVLEGGLAALGVVAAGLAVVFSFLSEVIGVVAKTIGILVGALFTLTNPMNELSAVLKEAQVRHDNLTASIVKTISGTQSAATATEEHVARMTEAGQAAAEEALAVLTTSKALEAQAFGAKLAADSTIDLSSRLVQLKAHIDTLLGAQEAQIEADVKLAKAAKIQGDSLVELTALRGKDFLSMEAQVTASEKYADALRTASESQRVETELLILKRDEIVKTAIAQDGNTRARRVEIEAIEKKIIASRAETEQAQQASDAAAQETANRKLAIQTYKDNSAAVGEFKLAMEAAQRTLDELIAGEKAGYITKEQVTVATRRVAEATNLYNDTIKDSIAKLDLQSRAQQANMNLALTKLQIEQRGYESLAQSLRASGDYTKALYFEVAAREKQIEAIRLTSEAKRLEAEATIKALEIERAALDQADPLLKQKQAEIDIRLANAKAKLLEADAGKIAIRALEDEIRALRENNDVREKGRQGTDKDTASREKNAEAINKQTAAMNKQTGTPNGAQYDSDGFALNTQGDRVNASTSPSPWRSIGGDWNYTDKNGNWRKSSKQPVPDPAGGWMEPGANRGISTGKAPAGTDSNASGNGSGATTGAGSGAAATGEAPPRVGATQTINISIGGKSTPVNVASAEDAANLTGILRQLESASGAAS